MGPITIPQLVDVVDTSTAVRSFSSGLSRTLTRCQVEPWGLHMAGDTPEDPFADGQVTWLLPSLGLRLTRRHPRSGWDTGDSVMASTLTAVRVQYGSRYWRTTDLLLGLAVPGGTTPRITHWAEFAAAVTGGVLRADDADLALRTVHRTLDELSRLRHDLGAWLTSHGVSAADSVS